MNMNHIYRVIFFTMLMLMTGNQAVLSQPRPVWWVITDPSIASFVSQEIDEVLAQANNSKQTWYKITFNKVNGSDEVIVDSRSLNAALADDQTSPASELNWLVVTHGILKVKNYRHETRLAGVDVATAAWVQDLVKKLPTPRGKINVVTLACYGAMSLTDFLPVLSAGSIFVSAAQTAQPVFFGDIFDWLVELAKLVGDRSTSQAKLSLAEVWSSFDTISDMYERYSPLLFIRGIGQVSSLNSEATVVQAEAHLLYRFSILAEYT